MLSMQQFCICEKETYAGIFPALKDYHKVQENKLENILQGLQMNRINQEA